MKAKRIKIRHLVVCLLIEMTNKYKDHLVLTLLIFPNYMTSASQ